MQNAKFSRILFRKIFLSKMSILPLLETTEIPNYKELSSSESLKKYESTLEELLQKADSNFENILAIKKEDANFKDVVQTYLDHDEKLGELFTFLHHLDSTCGNETTRKIIENIQPKIVAHGNKTGLSAELYHLLEAVEEKMSKNNPPSHPSQGGNSLEDEQQRSLFLLMRGMRLSGVHLEGEKKKRLEEINHCLSELSTTFSNNAVDSRKEFLHHFASDEFLKEVPEHDMALGAEEAKKQEKDGWVFTLSPPSFMAIMRYCSSSDIRQKFWEANVQIASSGKHDNRPLVLEMLTLRQEKAVLLGHKNYAEYALGDRMAESPQQVIDVLTTFATTAKGKAKHEFEELEKFAGIKLNHWDVAYYSEKLKKESFHLDNKILRKYFAMENVMNGLFEITKALFDVSFNEKKADLYHKDVLAYDVFLGEKKIAYVMMDLFARPEKRGGAWCNDLRSGKGKDAERTLPLVTVVGNFAKPAKGKPTLLTHEDVQTIFHEFGHALHVMLSTNTYENTSGFNTEWDFVELPSQLLENWTWEKEALSLYAKHHETGEILPENLFENLQKSRKFLKGMFLLRQNEFGFLDFLLHSKELPKTVEALDKRTLEIANTYSVLQKPDEYKMYTSFGHIFSGGYSAGYYSYLWAEILEADVFSLFQKNGVLNPETGKKYREEILEVGAKKDAAEIFQDFMGRDPNADALLRKLGFIE